MVSAAEHFASNLSMESFSKASELKKRIWFTLGALIIYRLGTYIPVPGIDPMIMGQILSQQKGGILGVFDMFSGGALGRMTVFALNIMPYISASIIVQLLSTTIPSLEALKKDGESGRQKINQYTRYLTLFIAMFQAYGIAVGLQAIHSPTGLSAVIHPGLFFISTCVLTLVGGSMFLMWIGEQITSRGVGNGISLIIFAGIVAGLPSATASLLELGRTGVLSGFFIAAFLVLALAVILFIVFMELAQFRVIIQYPKRQVGRRIYGGDSSHLPIKVNTAGVIPPIFASSILLLPLSLAGMVDPNTSPAWLVMISHHLSQGRPLYMLTYAALIIFFAYFYAAVTFNPEETADNLRKQGGFIPGIRPGAKTAAYFDSTLSRLTTIGAAYLVAVCLLPQFLITKYSVPFYFGGTSLIIIVTVTIDTVTQVQSHLVGHQYRGLIKKQSGRAGRRSAHKQR
ncbi:preprotein translocase subunit SecY [Acetobacteraceae bacterium]|nr:preprotein translocase subunit SecY [Acetobacteraceae bacterium]